MKSMMDRFVALAFMSSLIAGLFVVDSRAETQSVKQRSVSVISTGPSRTVVLNQFTVGKQIGKLGQFISIEVVGADLTTATGINNRSQVVGNYLDATGAHGFLLDRGKFMTVDIPGGSDTTLTGINASGQIIGVYRDSTGDPHGFLMEAGSVTHLDFPGSSETGPGGINDHGQIVGAYLGDDALVHAFLLDGGVFTSIDAPGALETWAEDINQQGQIVGGSFDSTSRYPGFLLNGDAFTVIDLEQSLFGTEVTGINAQGDVVGFVQLPLKGYLGFVEVGGSRTLIAFPSSTDTRPVDINDQGQIVGEYTDQNGNTRGFLVQ